MWVFGTVPDWVHKDLDVIIVMDESQYDFPGNIRSHIAEKLCQELGLKKVDWFTLNTRVAQKDLSLIRRNMELWKPDIACFYGDPITRLQLKNALRKTRMETGYWKKYDKQALRELIARRKKEKSQEP